MKNHNQLIMLYKAGFVLAEKNFSPGGTLLRHENFPGKILHILCVTFPILYILIYNIKFVATLIEYFIRLSLH